MSLTSSLPHTCQPGRFRLEGSFRYGPGEQRSITAYCSSGLWLWSLLCGKEPSRLTPVQNWSSALGAKRRMSLSVLLRKYELPSPRPGFTQVQARAVCETPGVHVHAACEAW